ncbi:hypothetical protein [Microbacterium sp. NPDC056057]
MRLRWVGHRLQGDAILATAAESSIRSHLRNVDDFTVTVRPTIEVGGRE